MPVFLFTGEDTYSIEQKVAFWRSEFEKKHGGDMNISFLSGKEATTDAIVSNAFSAPFLADKRLVIAKNFLEDGSKDDLGKMADKIEEVPEESVLLFWETKPADKRTSLYKKITKFGKVVEFAPISGSKLIAWINSEVAARGGTIASDATLMLAESFGGNLHRLSNELQKLIAYAGKNLITVADIRLLVEIPIEASIFKLTDAVGGKNKRMAIETLQQLSASGEELPRILYMIMRQFRIITCVWDLMKQKKNKAEITAEVKEHPFVISTAMGQAKHFTLPQLQRAYTLMIDLDTKMKSGGIKTVVGDQRELQLALDRLVLELCS